jgi:DNA-binding SARP family transcriptional activator
MPGIPEDAPEAIELHLLGPPRWQRPGAAAQPLAARDAALLALLALDGAQPRERIGAWLWPTATPRQLGISLRQRLFKLRRSTGHPVVQSGAMLQLAPGVRTDLLADPLLAEGTLLAGCDLGPLEALESWLQVARERIGIRQIQAWGGEAAQRESRGDLAGAMALCERIVAQRPATEHAWRRLMRLHWLQGDRAAAIASFERFEHQVCRELGLRPSAETLSLLETVERTDPTAAATGLQAPGLPASLRRPPRLVGRDRLLAGARAAWDAGRPVLLLADGGLGKSRLLEDLLHGQGPALMTRARPGDAAQPYGSLITWLAQALDRFAPTLAPEVRSELARLLPALGPAAAGEADQRCLWQAVEAMMAGCMAQGLRAWALDDLHLADAASLELLRWLLGSERLNGLHGAFAARPAGASGADVPAALGDTQRLEQLRLDPLSAEDMHDLVRSLGLPAWSDLPLARLSALHRHTGGQPFLLLETLKSLVIAGDAPGDGPLPVPPAADALIGQRLAALPPVAVALLQLLSVAGGPLRLAVAARAMQQPLPTLAQAWSQLAAAQLVQPGGGVAHDLLRDCVLRALPEAGCQAWHLALANAMADEPGVEPAVAALHWQAALQWPEAATAWRRAAAAASRAGRLAEWEQLLLKAAAAHGEAGDEGARLDDRIDALTARSLRLGPAAVATELQGLLAEGHHGDARARLLMLQGTLAFNQLRFDDVMQLADAALAQAHEGTATQQQARLLHGRAAAMSGRHDQALASLRQACQAAQALAQPERQLDALSTLAHALHGARQRAEAVAVQRQALQVARRHSGRFHQAECAANLAVLLLAAGEVNAVLEASEEALAGFAAMGVHDAPTTVMALSMRARAWAHRGRLASALHSLAPLATPGNAGLAGAMARTGLAHLHLILGWRGKALAVLDPDDPSAPPNLRAQTALVRVAAKAPGARAALRALGDAHPGLRDDAMVYREWSRWDPPAEAAERLDALAAIERAAGAPATARSLAVRAVACRLSTDPARAAAQARELVEEVDTGLHAGSHPPEVWGTLAAALAPQDPAAAARAAARGRAWLDAAELPPGARRAALSLPRQALAAR